MGGRDGREGGVGSGGGRIMGRKKQVDKEELIEYAKELYLKIIQKLRADKRLQDLL